MTCGDFHSVVAKETNSQAEELERNIFGPKRVIIVASAEQGENRVIREDEVLHGNRTLVNTVERET